MHLQICLHQVFLPDKQVWQSLGFDELQTIEIIRGIENGVDVSVYCKEEFNAAQMKALRLGLEEKLDASLISLITE